jgi:hypothetical protein
MFYPTNQPKPETKEERRARHYQAMKADEERDRLERAEQAAKAEEARQQQAQQQAEAERVRLETLRNERLLRETFNGLNPTERAEFERRTNTAAQVKELHTKARQQEEEEFAARIQREYEQELQSQRGGAVGERSARIQLAAQHKREKVQAFLAEREKRELQAETQQDETARLVYSLGDRGREIVAEQLKNQPAVIDTLHAVKQDVQQQTQAARNHELYTAFVQEMKAKNVRGHTWASNTRAKYVAMGMDSNYSEE